MSQKSVVVSSLIWKFMERIGSQAASFVVAIVLARLLAPADFGLIALVMVFIAIANVFVQSGLNTALVQKKNADDLDFSTVFYASLVVAALFYVLLFFSAPLLAAFFNGQIKIIEVIRVMGVTVFFGSLNSVQEAYVARNMMFKKLFYRSIGATIPSGLFGVILAYAGFEVWALVGQQLMNAFLVCAIMWFTVKWRPILAFSYTRFKGLFAFGWKLLVSSLLDTFYRNVRDLVIGKLFSPAELGFYNRGDQFPKIIITNINSSIQAVLLPSLSMVQDDRERLKLLARRSIRMSAFLLLPMMSGLAALAEPVTLFVLGEKWLPAVPFIRICCFSYAFWPIHTTNLSAINAVGRSDVFLKLEIIKKCYGFAVLVLFIWFFHSPIGIAMSAAVTAPLGSFVNAYPNKKILNYGFVEQMKDFLPSFVLAVAIGFGVYLLSKMIECSLIVQLPLLAFAGGFMYILCAWVFRFESLEYILNSIKEYLKKKK
ncbi:lipopolysaccharide biosynthesis protein [Fibrobacter sp. UWB10]|uniref:lipopolysaccharide biosynthesis protein n=1 Tax=Fibrobacter sp. UWB10 TaxID=1896201 RepID=UPI0024034E8A|nr:lipopolysaccharide biosynthesis protein [Fibrobacter sp. UWB10]SMP40388.1 Membrane protein involved in the export of O-antigen and teichoic acid [Fibrobacter sp. UWB10]